METQTSPLNVVDQLLVGMIERWPTLRPTRNDALYDLCVKTTEYGDEIEWDADGNIVFSTRSGEFDGSIDKTLEEEEAEVYARRGLKPSECANDALVNREILFRRREYAKKTFTRDNARLIVLSRDYGFGNTNPRDDAFRFLEEIPPHANPLWIDAFVGLAHDILAFKYPASKFEGMAPGYAEGYQRNLELAKEKARAFLIRAKGCDREKVELAKSQFEKELATLQERAARAGVKIEATIA